MEECHGKCLALIAEITRTIVGFERPNDMKSLIGFTSKDGIRKWLYVKVAFTFYTFMYTSSLESFRR